jgi:HK97 family phage portal protein
MGLWTRITGALGLKTGGSIDAWFSEFGGSRSTAGISVNQYSAMQVATVMSCVSILAEDVAKLPVHVYRSRKDGGRDIVTEHPVEKLLQSPNGFQSRFEFIEQMQAALLLRGNAYAPIIRDGRGRPTALIPVNPDRVSIYESPDGSVFYMVSRRGPHDMAMLEKLPLMVAAEDMLHVRWLSLDNSLYGASRIALARESIALALSQQELAGKLAANNTNLGGVLQTDQRLSKEAAERLARDWKAKKAGSRNAGDIAVLEQGLKWQQLGMTAQDAEFILSRNFSVEETARIFRMPPHKLGVAGRGNGSTIEQLDQDYMNNTVSSYLERWEAKIGQTFGLAEEGLFVEFDISRFLRAALQTRYASYRVGIVGMFLTPNEARRAEGLPDVAGGDKLYQPTNVAELGFEPTAPGSTGPGSDVSGAPAAGGTGDPAAAPDDSSDQSPSG